jgi:pimeloyl-ACP methyl ester carboxylesterase
MSARMLIKLLSVIVVAYGAILVTAYLAQTRMLFPRELVRPGGELPASATRLEIRLPSAETLRGLHIAAAMPGPERLVILGFGGNAWNADNMATYLHEIYPAAEIVTFHYRGYAPSDGQPSVDAFVADAPVVFDYVRKRFGDAPIVAVGFSIGSGVAASLAARRPLAGAILVTPFDSLTAVAAGQFPWLPVRWLFRHRLEPADELRDVRIPVALIAAGNDSLIPVAHAEALKRVVPNLAYARTIPGVGHNDIYNDSGFQESMREALRRVSQRASPIRAD